MDAVKMTDLFKGNQLEEIRYWLDWETPANNDDTWINTNPGCLLYTSPSPRDRQKARMPSSA